MKIFYLTEANVKHLQTYKLNITIPYLGWKEEEGQKGPLLVSLNTFWLLDLILLPHCCKIYQSYIIEPRPPLKKIGFSDQIRIKFKLW